MSQKFKRELIKLAQELEYYKISGRLLARKRFGTEPYYNNSLKECEVCGEKFGKLHRFWMFF